MSPALLTVCAIAILSGVSAQFATPFAAIESLAPLAVIESPAPLAAMESLSPMASSPEPVAPAPFSPADFSSCYHGCRMRSCNGVSSYSLGPLPDTPFTGPICSKVKPYVGTVLEVGEAYVHVTANRVTPVSYFSPALNVSYQRDVFDVYTFHHFNSVYKSKSGIGRRTMSPEQLAGLGGRCVIVPIMHYVTVGRRGVYNAAVTSANTFEDCFAFYIEPVAAPAPTRTPVPFQGIAV